MLPQKLSPARVINIASVNGMTNSKMNNYSYGASKAGLIHLTRHLAPMLARRGININAISPGYFESKMTNASEGGLDQIVKLIPLGVREQKTMQQELQYFSPLDPVPGLPGQP